MYIRSLIGLYTCKRKKTKTKDALMLIITMESNERNIKSKRASMLFHCSLENHKGGGGKERSEWLPNAIQAVWNFLYIMHL